MGDPSVRRKAVLSRLRKQLDKKRESLADQFDFKMYIVIHFKDKKKQNALFEVEEVLPVMTNNFEDTILKEAKRDENIYQDTRDLLEQDIVQLHAPRWQCLRKDMLGSPADVDYFLWPRKDIEKIQCVLFSKWKDEDVPYKPLQVNFEIYHGEYEKLLTRIINHRDRGKQIVNNPAESMFLFIDKQQLETSRSRVVVFKLFSLCVYLRQDQLLCWGPGTCAEVLETYF